MMDAPHPSSIEDAPDDGAVVSFQVAGKRFGIDIARVEDVFLVQDVTPVPLAPPAVVGIVNLRGKVVTVICLRALLGLTGAVPGIARRLAVGVARAGETYGFLIDQVGDVLPTCPAARDPVAAHVRDQWSCFALAIHKLADGLLVELDAERLTRLGDTAVAA